MPVDLERVKAEGNQRFIEYPINQAGDFEDFCQDIPGHMAMILGAFPYEQYPDLLVRVVLNYENPPGIRTFTRSGRRVIKNPNP